MTVTVISDSDGARATELAIALDSAGSRDRRAAVWVGSEDDAELAEFRDSLGL